MKDIKDKDEFLRGMLDSMSGSPHEAGQGVDYDYGYGWTPSEEKARHAEEQRRFVRFAIYIIASMLVGVAVVLGWWLI